MSDHELEVDTEEDFISAAENLDDDSAGDLDDLPEADEPQEDEL